MLTYKHEKQNIWIRALDTKQVLEFHGNNVLRLLSLITEVYNVKYPYFFCLDFFAQDTM